ncbi:AI-2E family transporter [Nakamurella endophytica]|uniref:AI-2E family transporter n=1 Tax=Nakamurella endophytica TaxID=1748367 RepID=A0A917SP45_9ACTN|nr:AI-2E family transporter [Nakamurella endophytica]GGL89379.1 AI-2E family transporter [Nakamurella endophytica]
MSRSGSPAAPDTGGSSPGHHDLLAQPHSHEEGPVADAERAAARDATPDRPLGRPGPRFDRRSPFFVGMWGSAGVAVTYGVVQAVPAAGQPLVLIGFGCFLAVGPEPAVSWLVLRLRMPRWAAVLTVLAGTAAVLATVLWSVVTPLVRKGAEYLRQAPHYWQQLQDEHSTLGRLNSRFHVQERLQQAVDASWSGLAHGALGVGRRVLGAVSSLLVTVVVMAYVLADLPRLRAAAYRLVPAERRARAVLLGDRMMLTVGGYVLGNLSISVVCGVTTFGWLWAVGVPYPLLLAVLAALLDLVPTIGVLASGILMGAAALTVSVPTCVATLVFLVVYQLVENYLLTPVIIGRTVHIPAVATVVSILVGGALLGVVGALTAIPVAAVLVLLAREVLFPRLDRRTGPAAHPPCERGLSP